MTATVTRARREPLTRQRVLSAALGYLDENGLAELSMHKLGAQLGVSGMSLYNHVADKDALLDGIVELLWDELAAAQPASGDWRQILRELGLSLRLLAHRHPRAVTLLLTRPVLSVPMLRVYQRALQAMADGGLPQPRALEVLRTVVGYTFGYALTELSALCATAGETQLQRMRRVSRMISDDLPDDLLEVAMTVCGECDMAGHFATGLDLILSGPEPGPGRG
ncbi:MAG TPA: TetR/AcrR family transcriptional regulator C-terminal domain-containing protein [Streptosporangiaceae bacterium]